MLKIPLLPLLLNLTCIGTQAQTVIPVLNPKPQFQEMKAYLGLSDAQLAQITINLNQYIQLIFQRQQRIYQVQTEIQQETAKSPLDPAALGIRYAEIETICRNVNDEAKAAQDRNQALLTDVQKVKLRALEEASNLLVLIAEGRNAGMLAPPGAYFTGTFAIPYVAAVLPGCQQPLYDPVSGSAIR
jgi:hypothetical protein